MEGPREGTSLRRERGVEEDLENIVITTINVTSIGSDESVSNREKLLDYDSHIVLIQEHAIAEQTRPTITREFDRRGWNLIAGPCIPECNKRIGGVPLPGLAESRLTRLVHGELSEPCISRVMRGLLLDGSPASSRDEAGTAVFRRPLPLMTGLSASRPG